MSILSSVDNLLTTKIVSDSWRGNGTYFFGMGPGEADLVVSGSKGWEWECFKNCGPVGSIITRKAEMLMNGDVWILNKAGTNKGKESNSDIARKLRTLLSQPNPMQSWSQFEAQASIYYQTYGYCIILPIYPVGFSAKSDITRLWIIPPFLIDIEETKKIWYANDGKTIQKIILNTGQETATLNYDELFILKDFIPTEYSSVLPGSRLESVINPILTIIQGFTSVKNGMRNTPLGIVGNDTKDSQSFIPLLPEEKDRIESELRMKGLGDRQQSIIVSNANLTWTPINYPIDSLKLPEHIKVSVEAICDRLGYHFELLSNAQGTTFSNKREAQKATYQDFIIPMSKSIYEQLNNFFETEKAGIVIDKDFSNLPILQEDAAKRAIARKAGNEAYLIEFENDLITVNRWLELNGEDTRGADGDYYYSAWIRLHPELLKMKNPNTESVHLTN